MTKQEALDQIDKLKAYVDGIKDTDKERDEWFLSVLNGLVMEVKENYVSYKYKSGESVFIDFKNGNILFNNDLVRLLMDKYNMKGKDAYTCIKDMLLKHTGWKVDFINSFLHPYNKSVVVGFVQSCGRGNRLNGYDL